MSYRKNCQALSQNCQELPQRFWAFTAHFLAVTAQILGSYRKHFQERSQTLPSSMFLIFFNPMERGALYIPPLEVFCPSYSKNLKATHNWKFLTYPNFCCGCPHEKKSRNLVLLPFRSLWNMGLKIVHRGGGSGTWRFPRPDIHHSNVSLTKVSEIS